MRILLALELAKEAGNCRRCLQSGLFDHTLAETVEDILAEPLRTTGQMTLKPLRERVRRPPGPFETLRRHPDARNAAEDRAFWTPSIVAIQIRGRIGGEDVKLQKVGHDAILRWRRTSGVQTEP